MREPKSIEYPSKDQSRMFLLHIKPDGSYQIFVQNSGRGYDYSDPITNVSHVDERHVRELMKDDVAAYRDRIKSG